MPLSSHSLKGFDDEILQRKLEKRGYNVTSRQTAEIVNIAI